MSIAKPFKRLLVANRGEIALRILRTAKANGLETVAVYTTADATAPYVAYADHAVHIGEGPAVDSYLSIHRLLEAARESGAEAVHPGYGFLSENPDFVKECAAAGLVFIGPTAEAVAKMGSKAEAKRLMIEAGVPCIPGYDGSDQSPKALKTAAAEIGFPVMIKAVAGGGGRGMRLVQQATDFDTALETATSEAQSAFGDRAVILEKAIQRPRHVEVQIIADTRGTVLHLGERDCSVQRRHQKVVEEAPCPVLSDELRARMGAAAVEAATAIGYVGAGTVEFILDDKNEFYFLEMNTRLQVEHPVTELVTGQDLVELQLRVAAGEPLGIVQKDIALNGHAVEVRLYAEDPGNGFLPSTGRIGIWREPKGPGIRVDSGIEQGLEVSPFYDPMLAKIIAHGETRTIAIDRLRKALEETVLFGPACNRDFLLNVLAQPDFENGAATTALIADTFPDGGPDQSLGFDEIALGGFLVFEALQEQAFRQSLLTDRTLLGFTSAGISKSRMTLVDGDSVVQLAVKGDRSGHVTVISDEKQSVFERGPNVLRQDGRRVNLVTSHYANGQIYVATTDRLFSLGHRKAGGQADRHAVGGDVRAPMHGTLIALAVDKDMRVEKGQQIAVLEAMKMQHELTSEVSGIVTQILVAKGQQVQAGDLIVEITEDPT